MEMDTIIYGSEFIFKIIHLLYLLLALNYSLLTTSYKLLTTLSSLSLSPRIRRNIFQT